MKNFKVFSIIFASLLVFSLILFFFFSFSVSQEKGYLTYLLISNETRKKEEEIKKAENIVKEIKSAYNKKLYHKVIELLADLPSDFSLTPEENLIISKSALNSGFPDKAIEFSEKVISVKKGTYPACVANLMKSKALIVEEDYKNAKKEIEEILGFYCDESIKKEAKILLHLIQGLPEEELKKIDPVIVKNIEGEIYKLKGLFNIRKGEIKKAEENFFTYINVFGNFKEAGELIYLLAEEYLKREEKERAKIFYQLIITNWDGTKYALFSKFRLYQMAYEKILIKELIPEKTKEDLIALATSIQNRYPEEKIAEEASFTIVKTYFEDRNYLLAKNNAIKFLESYKRSPLNNEVEMYYCESVSNLLQEFYEKKALFSIVQIEKEDKKFFEKTKCDKAYYILGEIYLNYNLYTKGEYYFIKAFEVGKREDIGYKALARLGVLALEEDERDLSGDIFQFVRKKENILKDDPYYLYLKAFWISRNNLSKAEIFLNLVLNSSLPEQFKSSLLKHFRDNAIFQRNYIKALDYTLNPNFRANENDFLLLLLETFDKDSSSFEKILSYAKKRYPENPKIKWLFAYYLEKKGNIKDSKKLWQELTPGNSLESELARSYEKMRYLIEKTHQMVF